MFIQARERPVEADVCVKRKLGVQACKAVLMEFISMHTSHCGFGLSKERQMQADVLVQQLEAKNEQLDMQQLQVYDRVFCSILDSHDVNNPEDTSFFWLFVVCACDACGRW